MASKNNKNGNGLSETEDLFLSYYFTNGFNASAAYKLIKPNVSDETARVNASKLLIKTNVAAEVERRKLVIRSKSEIKTEEIVEHLKNLLQKCVDEDDRANLLKTLDMMNKMQGNYLQKMDVTTNGNSITDIKINIIKPKDKK